MISLGRTSGSGRNVADKESSSASMTLRDGNNFKASAKDYKVCSLGRRNINHRCGYFTILSADANGIWRAVAVPFQCLNVRKQEGSGSQSITDGTFSGPKVHCHCQSKALTSEVRRGNVLPEKSSCQSSVTNSGSDVTNVSDIRVSTSKSGKPRERNNRKKAKKKGKRDQKLSIDAGSPVVTCIHGSSTDGNVSGKNADSTGSVLCETASTVLCPDSSCNNSEDNGGGIDVVDMLGTSSSSQPSSFNSTCGTPSAFPKFSAMEIVQDSLFESLNCLKDSGSSILSEMNNSNVPDSISVCSNADDFDVSSSSSTDMNHKQSGKILSSSNASKISSLSKFLGHSAEKKISWGKVCVNDADECSSGLVKVESFDSHCVNGSEKASSVKKNHNVFQSELLSTGKDKNQLKGKTPENLRRRISIGSKQELNCQSTSNLCTNIGMELNDAVDISQPLGRETGLVGFSKSLSNVDCSSIEYEAEKVDSNACGSANQLESCSSEVEPFEEFCSASSFGLNDQTAKQECKSIPPPLGYSSQMEIVDSRSAVVFNPTGTEGLERGKDMSAFHHNKHDQLSGPTMHKWIPIDIKSCELDHSSSSQLVDKEAVEGSNSENAAMKMPKSEPFDGAKNSSTKGFEQDSRAENSQQSGTEALICNDSVETAADNVSNMIRQAVKDAYRAQLASEAVEKVLGCPVAELERFLRSASPVVSLPNSISHSRTCSPDEVSVAPLCRHEIPNLTLGNLWQWYERHGTFGLEVKAEDCENLKRLGVDRFAFRAYFVPFLSAVQLFSPHYRCSSGTGRRFSDIGASMASKLAKNSSNSGHVPIFSGLVPQPRMMGNAAKQFDDSTSSDELELVYEYFEAERPQQRRPLFEMIKDLVSGNESLQGRAFGDPSKLFSMEINDLHPNSWYSVAWYPIYRIPDEKFRSAFLTYHSLGHFTYESALTDSFTGNACVISPVVGLQSYNTQGECWLQPRNLTESQSKAIPNLNHFEILKEQLRTLEHTASVMARAEVVKGNATSVNRQPDYEFFLSRSCQ